ncbi:kinase-like protein [Rhizoclosmatium globosum]|uniref:non-specific serine/threonine protein kinase n=1 Tax=Rhizoclosmatium globosum TaxID=329046 RepID=A0A1Y2C2E2_9FUNG|nr:kinase-like protein [Rhizoclosmatium globosum]|eukprot:ORY41212.1 kinase-like protein [Rhizoclosmatium globosum]
MTGVFIESNTDQQKKPDDPNATETNDAKDKPQPQHTNNTSASLVVTTVNTPSHIPTHILSPSTDPASLYSPSSSTQPLVSVANTSKMEQPRTSKQDDEPRHTASEKQKASDRKKSDDHNSKDVVGDLPSPGAAANGESGRRPSKQNSTANKEKGEKEKEKEKEKTAEGKTSTTKEKSDKTASKNSLSSNNMIGTHYKVGKKIGEGSFGVIYEGLNMLNNVPIAIKFEPRKSDAPQLRDEYKTYRLLANSVGIPNAYYFGQEGLHNVLCIDLLGPSLEDMFDLCHRKFSVKTTCMVAKQMITRVQTIHEKNLIYRDIKPDNFLIGRLSRYEPQPILQSHSATHPHPASMVYMVDFGMAKQYRDPKTKVHIPYREKKSLSGTARYMSVNTHLGREQSRRDDLEALGHVFFYFLRGSLPWQGLKAATNKQKYEKIGEKKQTTPIKELCEGHPEEFSIYQQYVRDLKFDEQPDYDYLKGLLNKVLAKNGFIDDGIYDWMVELDHQRNKKERQRASENQKKVVDASTAAVHQSNAEGLTPQSNGALAPLTPTSPLISGSNVAVKPKTEKSDVKEEKTPSPVEQPATNTNSPPKESVAKKEDPTPRPKPSSKKDVKEAEPKESVASPRKAGEKKKKKSFWASCCGGDGDG